MFLNRIKLYIKIYYNKYCKRNLDQRFDNAQVVIRIKVKLRVILTIELCRDN